MELTKAVLVAEQQLLVKEVLRQKDMVVKNGRHVENSVVEKLVRMKLEAVVRGEGMKVDPLWKKEPAKWGCDIHFEKMVATRGHLVTASAAVAMRGHLVTAAAAMCSGKLSSFASTGYPSHSRKLARSPASQNHHFPGLQSPRTPQIQDRIPSLLHGCSSCFNSHIHEPQSMNCYTNAVV